MKVMSKLVGKSKVAQAILAILAIVVIANPELFALIFTVNAIGLEIFALFLIFQISDKILFVRDFVLLLIAGSVSAIKRILRFRL